jgi:putative aldouronate transport system permease protein
MAYSLRRPNKKTASDYFIDILAYTSATLVMIIAAYPFIYTFSCSISDPAAVLANKVLLLPVGFSTLAYRSILESGAIWGYYYNTIWYTVVGTALSVLVTCLTAYPLARKQFFARNFFMVYITLPMFIGGGLIPFFLVVVKMGLYNSRWSMIIPSMIAVYNLIICRTFFQGTPDELIDSARIDGCSHLRTLFSIVLPLSKAIIAVLIIFYGVGQWNSWFNAILFLTSDKYQPLQVYLRRVLLQMSPEALRNIMTSSRDQAMSYFQLKYAVVFVAIGPIIMIYPFFQKYFVKGVMIGSLKG